MNTLHNTKKCMWIVMFAVVAVILFAIFAFNRRTEVPAEIRDYAEELRVLNDSIVELQENIRLYEEAISRIEQEKLFLRRQLNAILKDNEKTDSMLIDGDLDYNIKFLAEYLSEEGSVRQGHGSVHNGGSTCEGKPGD